MREPDAVERVLASLGGATPGEGMEARVLARLAAECVHEPQSYWLASQFLSRGWTIAGVVAVLLCGVAVVRGRHTTPGKIAQRPAQQRQIGRQTVSAPFDTADVRGVFVRNTSSRQCRAEERTKLQRVRLPAVADSTAGLKSFPAPPMPLTRQERLLLRMLASNGQAELVATVGPRAEGLVSLRERAEFSEFFRPGGRTGEAARDTGLDGR